MEELDLEDVERRGTPLVVLWPELVETRFKLALALVDEVEEVAFDIVRRESWYIGCGEGCCDEVVML